MAWSGLVWLGTVRLGSARRGITGFEMRRGEVGHALAVLGAARSGEAMLGNARQGN